MPKHDEMPIMQHEVAVEGGSDENHDGTVFVKQYSRPSSVKLAVVTLVIFVAALAFLVLLLITPIFYSLSHPVTHDTGNHNHDMPMTEHEHSEHSDESMPMSHTDHHEDRRKRSISDLALGFRAHVKDICPCFSSLNFHDVTSAQFKSCIQSCKPWRHPDSQN